MGVSRSTMRAGSHYVGYVLSQTLDATQKAAIVLAALVAADFFIFTPNVGSTFILEDRVKTQAVRDSYGYRPVPDVVNRTLNMVGALSVSRAQSPGLPGPFPLADLCAKSHNMVESLFTSACVPPLRIDVPFYDRVLLNVNEQTDAPLEAGALQEAARFLAEAVFVRATVTISNTGRSAATNVTVNTPYGFHVAVPPPTLLEIGKSVTVSYDSDPVSQSANGAEVNAPTFRARADPTGPLDPSVIKLAFVALLIWCLLVAVSSAIAGPPGDGRTTLAAVR